MKAVKGREVIWEGLTESCLIEDKSFASLTRELNLMFKKYNINKCIQKITFFAQVNAETGFFSLSHEEKSKYLSSQSIYKGRGIIQLTGEQKSGEDYYNKPGPYSNYGEYIGKGDKFVQKPNLIAEDLHYTVDSAGWEWSVEKKVPNWNPNKYTNQTIKEAAKWKRENFPKGLGKSLNEIALAYEETGEEKYFWLQSKVLNGYAITHKYTPDPHGWTKRKEGLQKVKDWFKYDKAVCKGEKELIYNEILDNPLFNYVKIAGSFIGIKEGGNKTIASFFTETGHSGYTDKTAWCAAFANYCLKNGNPEIPRKNGLNAVSFSYSGYEEVDTPYYGSFMVRADNGTFYKQGSQGHVAIVVGKIGDAFAQLGGNQAVPGEKDGTTVNVVLRKRQNNVKYFHPKEVPKIELNEPLFKPAEKNAGVDTGRMNR